MNLVSWKVTYKTADEYVVKCQAEHLQHYPISLPVVQSYTTASRENIKKLTWPVRPSFVCISLHLSSPSPELGLLPIGLI